MIAIPCMLCSEGAESLDGMMRHIEESHDPAELMAWIAIHLPATSTVVDTLITEDKSPDTAIPALLRAMATDMERKPDADE